MMQNALVRLSFADTLHGAVSVFLSRYDLFIAIAAVMYLPFVLERYFFPFPDPDEMWWHLRNHLNILEDSPMVVDIILHLESHMDAFVTSLGQSAIVYVVAELYVGKRSPDLKSSLSYATTVWWKVSLVRLLWGGIAFLLAAIIIACCMFFEDVTSFTTAPRLFFLTCLVTEAIFVSIPMSILLPVLTIERGCSVRDGLQRVWTLANMSRWYIFSTSLAVGVISFFSFVIVSFLFQGRGGLFLSSLPFLVFDPLKSILVTVVYLGIRSEREGLGLDLLEAELTNTSTDGGGLVEQLISSSSSSVANKEAALDEGVEISTFDQELL